MQLHYKTYGQGEPLVLLHGLFGSSDNWHGIATRLAERFQVLVPDLRNHGRSPHSAEMNYGVMAGDVAELLETLAERGSVTPSHSPAGRGLNPASDASDQVGAAAHRAALRGTTAAVLGHSMGGKVAMQLALTHPNLPHKLVVADMAPRAYAPRHLEILSAMMALDVASFSSRQDIEAALAGPVPSLNLRRFLLKNLGRGAGGEFEWKINLAALSEHYPDLRAALSAPHPYAGPTLFLRGERSDYIQAADEPLIFELFPRAEIRTIPGAGHWLHADAPDEFVRLVREFPG